MPDFFASARQVDISQCEFYHTMDLPGVGRVNGQWDLRGKVDDYLGHVNLQGKRVLEIGPASGYLSVEMEKRGASVTAVEMKDDDGWDFAPYPAEKIASDKRQFTTHMDHIKNSWWLTQQTTQSHARMYYGSAYSLPDEIGQFDVALMAAVLLHTRHPVQIMEQCAKRAQTLIITDLFRRDLEGQPVAYLMPNVTNNSWHTWWNFSTKFIIQFVEVMGFTATLTRHTQKAFNSTWPMFTVVATKA